MSTPAETPRPLAERLHDHEPITAAESRALALLLWQVQHADRFAEKQGFDDATHFALWTGIRDVYIHEPALTPTAPSSGDTPARVWQEGDPEPEGVELVHDAGDLIAAYPYARRASDGRWLWVSAPDEQIYDLGYLTWPELLKDAHGPVSEVPAGGEA